MVTVVNTAKTEAKPNGEVAKVGNPKPTAPPGAKTGVCPCGCGMVFVRTPLLLANVRSNQALQMRSKFDASSAKDYAEHYKRVLKRELLEGETPFALVQVVQLDDGTHVVVDGFHRRAGMEIAGVEEFDFLIAKGSMIAAAKHAARANLTATQIRYTTADKRNACIKLWALHGSSKVSSHEVAKIAGVDHKTAQKYNPNRPAEETPPPAGTAPPATPATAGAPRGEIPQPSQAAVASVETAATPAAPVATPAAPAVATPPKIPVSAPAEPPKEAVVMTTEVTSAPAGKPPVVAPAKDDSSKPTPTVATKSRYTDLSAEGQQGFSLEPEAKRCFSVGQLDLQIEIIRIQDGRVSGYIRILSPARVDGVAS